MRTFMEDDSLSIVINSHYNPNLNETTFFFLYTTFSQLFLFTEMIRGDKNDLISFALLLFLVAVYAHHQQNQQMLLACCVCWPQCMIAITHNVWSTIRHKPNLVAFSANTKGIRDDVWTTLFTVRQCGWAKHFANAR